MPKPHHAEIVNIPEISAIYYALLQCRYDFHTIERSPEHCAQLMRFADPDAVPQFFSSVRQDTCAVYPYWPRAAILETATFFLSPDHSHFLGYDVFRERIMTAANISDAERNAQLWNWIADFPSSLRSVLNSAAFCRYLKWNREWSAAQSRQYAPQLSQIQRCLDMCADEYGTSIHQISIVIDPIKCVYSSDHHLNDGHFVFISGAFRSDSVIHEFLHHAVHPAVMALREPILSNWQACPDIDDSYYLSGKLNAFEEYAVRRLTADILDTNRAPALDVWLQSLIHP